MKGTPTGAERHPKLAKRMVFDDEYMMTEKEIAAVFERWLKDEEKNPNEYATRAELRDGVETVPHARQFLDLLSEVRCEALGLSL